MRSTPAFRFALAALAMGLLAACATDDQTTAAATEVVTEVVVETEEMVETEEVVEVVTETVVETEVATPDGDGAVQPFPANTATDIAEATGDQVALADVRVGTHDGYDRVTFEFAGDGAPGWVVQYVEEPTAQGSGRPVELAGDAALSGLIRPVARPGTTDTSYDGPERITAERLEVIEEVVVGTTFEANLGIFVGVDEQVPFRVQRFADPPRVVVDVVHPDRVP
jgi:hypothetical protein